MKAELFELLFRVLHHNWRYFFKSSVLASVQRGVAEEQMENEAQFSAIMQVTRLLPWLSRTLSAAEHVLLLLALLQTRGVGRGLGLAFRNH